MGRTGLIIIFNHRYDRNLPLLRKIYRSRFSIVRFLVPFYDGRDADVIPVYECSYQFQGYLIQAYEKINSLPCDTFLFIADDMIINPMWSDDNVEFALKFDEKYFFMSGISPVNRKNGFAWTHARFSSHPFYCQGTRYQDEIPPFEYAVEKFEKFIGSPCNMFYDSDFFGEAEVTEREAVDNFIQSNRGKQIPYPLVVAYSDYFLIKHTQLYKFARLCGIFAAMNLFVEIAIPTAAMLTFHRENVLMLRETGYRDKIMWGEERNEIKQKYQCSVTKLLSEWEDDLFCVHPIKFSEWEWG